MFPWFLLPIFLAKCAIRTCYVCRYVGIDSKGLRLVGHKFGGDFVVEAPANAPR